MKLRYSFRSFCAVRIHGVFLMFCASVSLSLGQNATPAQPTPAAAPATAVAPAPAAAAPAAAAPAATTAVQTQAMTATTTDLQSPKIPAEQLDSLVAPIALYPDQLLA